MAKMKGSTLDSIISWYKENSSGSVLRSEEGVKHGIINKMLEGLGYNYGEGKGHYEAEYLLPQIGSNTARMRCDYIVRSTFTFIIEAKAIGESVSNSHHIAELASYVHNLQASIGILTNGREWSFFFTDSASVMESTPFHKIDFDAINADDKKFIIDYFSEPTSEIGEIAKIYKAMRASEDRKRAVAIISSAFLNRGAFNFSDAVLKEIIHVVEPDRKVITGDYLATYDTLFAEARAQAIAKMAATVTISKYENRIEREEAEVFGFVQGILYDLYEKGEINFSDYDSGCLMKIHFGNSKSGKPIMWVEGAVKEETYHFIGIRFPKTNGRPDSLIRMESASDIWEYVDRIRAEAKISHDTIRFQTEEQEIPTDASQSVNVPAHASQPDANQVETTVA